jgi:hypothetical protein
MHNPLPAIAKNENADSGKCAYALLTYIVTNGHNEGPTGVFLCRHLHITVIAKCHLQHDSKPLDL